jgi:hypothetical protein
MAKAKRSAWRKDKEALVKFATNLVGAEMTPFQEDMLRAIWSERRVAIASGHGMGKGYCGGLAVLGFCMLNPHPMAVITAPTGRQAKRTLWSELRSHHDKLSKRTLSIDGTEANVSLDGHTFNDTEWRIQRKYSSLAKTVAMHYSVRPSEETSFQGIHSPQLLVLIDEAAGVDERIVKAAETLATGRDNKVVLSGNPTNPGAFEKAFQDGSGWARVAASCLEHPNVLTGREIVPGAVTREFVNDMWNDCGDGEPIKWPDGEIADLFTWPEWIRVSVWENVWWMGHVLGKFPQEGDQNLVKYGDIIRALSADFGGAGHVTMGVDVARYGKDSTVIVIASPKDVLEITSYPKTSGPDVVALVHNKAKEFGVAPEDVRIDATGIGGMGVADWIDKTSDLTAVQRELWSEVEEVEFGAAANDSSRFLNMRAELLWRLKERFERGDIGLKRLGSRMKTILENQLRAMRFEYRGTKLAMEAKKALKKRTGSSPDEAEALALALIPSNRAFYEEDKSGGPADTKEELRRLEEAGFLFVGTAGPKKFFEEDDEDLQDRLLAELDSGADSADKEW